MDFFISSSRSSILWIGYEIYLDLLRLSERKYVVDIFGDLFVKIALLLIDERVIRNKFFVGLNYNSFHKII